MFRLFSSLTFVLTTCTANITSLLNLSPTSFTHFQPLSFTKSSSTLPGPADFPFFCIPVILILSLFWFQTECVFYSSSLWDCQLRIIKTEQILGLRYFLPTWHPSHFWSMFLPAICYCIPYPHHYQPQPVGTIIIYSILNNHKDQLINHAPYHSHQQARYVPMQYWINGQLEEAWKLSEKRNCLVMMSMTFVSDDLMLTWKSKGKKKSVEAVFFMWLNH